MKRQIDVNKVIYPDDCVKYDGTNMNICREIVTKERLYERLNNEIKKTEMTIMREEARLEVLRHTKRNLDEYFEDLEKSEDKE